MSFINLCKIWCTHHGLWTLGFYSVRHTTISREVSRTRDSDLEFFDRSKIWHALRQQRCREACKILERCNYYNFKFRCHETSRDLAVRLELVTRGPDVFADDICCHGHDHRICSHAMYYSVEWLWTKTAHRLLLLIVVLVVIAGGNLDHH